MAPELMLDLARKAAELLVERIESLPEENAWEGEFKEDLADRLMEAPSEAGRPAEEVLEQAARAQMVFPAVRGRLPAGEGPEHARGRLRRSPRYPPGHGVGRESPELFGSRPATEPLGTGVEDLSVRALKIWMSIQTFGMAAFRRAVSQGMELAARAEVYVHASWTLEMLNPASLDDVCFRINPAGAALGEEALEEIDRTVLACVFWEDRAFMPSTRLHGTFSLRLCIVNHVTTWDDVRETLEAAERFGREALNSN